MSENHHHHHLPDPQDKRYRETRKVTLIGTALDFLLGVAKIIVGIIGNSQALIADGIHSFSDLVTDFMVLFAAKHASREADEEHPYGHGRIETLMTVGLGIALILVGIGIGYDSARRLFAPELLWHPGWLALVVAAISIFSKEAIYHYTMHYAKKLRSNLLRANAWHSRTDAISSVVVFVGVLGSMAGLDYLDAIAAIGVALMIAKIGWDLAWHSIRELIDTGLDTERVKKIQDFIQSIDGVVDLHMLRTRRMGADALVDVHIQVRPRLSVSEGHYISETVRHRLISEFDEISDVMVHIDPENDEEVKPCCSMPLRHEIIDKANKTWSDIPGAEMIKDITLHYLGNKVHLELLLPLAQLKDLDQARNLASALQEAGQSLEEVGEVTVRYS